MVGRSSLGARAALIFAAIILIGLCAVAVGDGRITFRRQFENVVFNRMVMFSLGVVATTLSVQVTFTATGQKFAGADGVTLSELSSNLSSFFAEFPGFLGTLILAIFTAVHGLKTVPIIGAWASTS